MAQRRERETTTLDNNSLSTRVQEEYLIYTILGELRPQSPLPDQLAPILQTTLWKHINSLEVPEIVALDERFNLSGVNTGERREGSKALEESALQALRSHNETFRAFLPLQEDSLGRTVWGIWYPAEISLLYPHISPTHMVETMSLQYLQPSEEAVRNMQDQGVIPSIHTGKYNQEGAETIVRPHPRERRLSYDFFNTPADGLTQDTIQELRNGMQRRGEWLRRQVEKTIDPAELILGGRYQGGREGTKSYNNVTFGQDIFNEDTTYWFGTSISELKTKLQGKPRALELLEAAYGWILYAQKKHIDDSVPKDMKDALRFSVAWHAYRTAFENDFERLKGTAAESLVDLLGEEVAQALINTCFGLPKVARDHPPHNELIRTNGGKVSVEVSRDETGRIVYVKPGSAKLLEKGKEDAAE